MHSFPEKTITVFFTLFSRGFRVVNAFFYKIVFGRSIRSSPTNLNPIAYGFRSTTPRWSGPDTPTQTRLHVVRSLTQLVDDQTGRKHKHGGYQAAPYGHEVQRRARPVRENRERRFVHGVPNRLREYLKGAAACSDGLSNTRPYLGTGGKTFRTISIHARTINTRSPGVVSHIRTLVVVVRV